jgi:hypothetical protein
MNIKKMKSKVERLNWKTNPIKKMIKKTYSNQKNENQI